MDNDGNLVELLRAIGRQRRLFAAVRGWQETKRASAEAKPVYEAVRGYWARRKAEGATACQAARELGLPSSTFRRWAGIGTPSPRQVSFRSRYKDAFVLVEVAERFLSFRMNPEEPSAAASSGPVVLTLGDLRVEGIQADSLVPLLRKLK